MVIVWIYDSFCHCTLWNDGLQQICEDLLFLSPPPKKSPATYLDTLLWSHLQHNNSHISVILTFVLMTGSNVAVIKILPICLCVMWRIIAFTKLQLKFQFRSPFAKWFLVKFQVMNTNIWNAFKTFKNSHNLLAFFFTLPKIYHQPHIKVPVTLLKPEKKAICKGA